MEMAKIVAKRMTCERAQVGALVVKNNRVVSMGYGGVPSGLPHCTDVGCKTGPDGGCIATAHAEANAISFAAKEGIAVKGSEMYVTLSPCLNCAKLIINSGIVKVYYLEKYRDSSGIELLHEAGVIIMDYSLVLERKKNLRPLIGTILDQEV